MTVISFNFTKINAERIKGIKGKLNISNNVSIKDVKSFDLKLGKNKEKALKFDFKFEAVYDPKIGNIELLGEVVYLGKEETIKEVSAPTSLDVPASIPSGLSVVSLITNTGFPNEGASSCTPPESVKIICVCFIK